MTKCKQEYNSAIQYPPKNWEIIQKTWSNSLICSMRHKEKSPNHLVPNYTEKKWWHVHHIKWYRCCWIYSTLHDYNTSNVLPSEKGRVGSNQLLLITYQTCAVNGPKEPPKTARALLSLSKERFTSLTAIQAKIYHMGANT